MKRTDCNRVCLYMSTLARLVDLLKAHLETLQVGPRLNDYALVQGDGGLIEEISRTTTGGQAGRGDFHSEELTSSGEDKCAYRE